jgi:hypothetical protein
MAANCLTECKTCGRLAAPRCSGHLDRRLFQRFKRKARPVRVAIASVLAIVLVAAAESATAEPVAYTSETDYLNALGVLGLPSVSESFEDDAAWGSVRSTIVGGNHTAPSTISQGITWTSNNSVSQVTTGPGPVRTGDWGFYTLPHGDYANGIGDGFRLTSAGPMFAVGGWVETNTPFAKVHFIINDSLTVDFDDLQIGTLHQFLGVIDTAGFAILEIREVEGVLEDQKFIFADDFTIAVPEPSTHLLCMSAVAIWFAIAATKLFQNSRHGNPSGIGRSY